MNKKFTEKEIKECRHSKEPLLLGFAAFITLAVLMLVFIGSFFRTDIYNFAEKTVISDYATEHMLDEHTSPEDILPQLASDDRKLLKLLEFYYWPIIILIPLVFLILITFLIGKMYGKTRGSAVRLNHKQYPEIYKLYVDMATQLGFTKIPELYLVSGNGVLNAFASCVPGSRNFAAIYSDIFERCLRNNDMNTLRFVLGHELGHIKLNHVKWWYMFLIAWTNLPVIKYFIGLPLSRSREYGCDVIGAKLAGDTSGTGLMILGSGKYAYQDIDIDAYLKDQYDPKSFWMWVANLQQDHGFVSWRIAALRRGHEAGLIFKTKKKDV